MAPTCLVLIVGAAGAAAFGAPPRAPISASAAHRRAAASPSMKDWSKRKTLAESNGVDVSDASAVGYASAVGLEGTIPVVFSHGNETISTMAIVGQPLSEVASQAGQYIKYKCGKGECGTCEVRVDGKWIRTCSTKVPALTPGVPYEVFVRESMVQTKKASRFFSIRSFIAGFRNNLLGMVGFVREGRKSQNRFEERMDDERRIMELAAAKKKRRSSGESK